ncbi:MAG: SusC/RagA family protein [Sphingobacteriales bacterium UTBCD1]|jgi:iron complex outermembrane receptor protein|nr:MAG: SusC/RagA family protein [Sphingobacteriales bacterium UTBCD1]
MSIPKILKRIILPLLLLVYQVALSQDRVITGKVTDSKDGTPLHGVTILASGTTAGTETGGDGTYRITVSPSVTSLVFSFVGYTTLTVPIQGRTLINVSLSVASSSLAEVVIIGYGTTTKKDLTGSITSVTAKDFDKGIVTTPEQLISGKVAGVQITSNGGAPGSGSTIRIRGGASLNASNDPLIVIDGVPIDNSGIPGAANALALINPNDIESFNILKDASAAAIYGSRASNGVIIITTKKGKSGKPKFNFSTQNSVSTLSNDVAVLSPAEFRVYVITHGSPAQAAVMGKYGTDWQSQIYSNALSSDNNLSVSGSLKSVPYRLSLGYLNQDGILKTGNLQRKSVSIALNPKLFDNHLKIDISILGAINNTRFADQGAIGTAVQFDPTQPVYSSSNRFGGYFEWLDPSSVTGLKKLAPINPLGLLEQKLDKSAVKRSIGNMHLDYKVHFLPDLHVNMDLGYDVSKGEGTVFVPDSAASAYMRSPDAKHGGVNNRYLQKRSNTLFDIYLNYTKDLKSVRSRIDATAGYSYSKYLTTNIYAEKDPNGPLYEDPLSHTLNTVANNGQRWTPYSDYGANGYFMPTGFPSNPFDKPERVILSAFGRLVYTFNNKYILTGTIRRDGSSVFSGIPGSNLFSSGQNWAGWFPSGAFAWRIKDEDFLKDSKLISDLKLRLGLGVTGQSDGIGYYSYLASYSASNAQAQYQFGNTFYTMYRPDAFNDHLKWEQTKTSNIGLDYGFWNNRINGSIDFYLKNTSNLLSVVDQPAGTNFGNKVIANIGTMENRGVEFTINTEPIKQKSFVWDLNFNITYNKNKITKLTFVNDPTFPGNLVGGIAGGVGSSIQIYSVGYPKNAFYVYQQIYDQNGKPIEGLFEDRNRDGIINNNDLYRYESPDPRIFLGVSTNVTWKKWSAALSARANIGNYMYNNVFSNTGVQRNIINPLGYLNNGSRNVLETNFTGNGDQYLLSDYYVENASFFRMDFFNLGYDAGDVLSKNTHLRIGATIQNWFTITKYKGVDPEVPGGIDNNFYPRPRIYSINLNLDF